MPYHARLEGEIIQIDFFEVATSRDFVEIASVMEELERSCTAVPHRITDVSKTSGMNIGFTDILALADRRKALRFKNTFKSAIVAPQPVQLGLARMFQILNDHPQITIKIFSDLAATQAWIAEG